MQWAERRLDLFPYPDSSLLLCLSGTPAGFFELEFPGVEFLEHGLEGGDVFVGKVFGFADVAFEVVESWGVSVLSVVDDFPFSFAHSAGAFAAPLPPIERAGSFGGGCFGSSVDEGKETFPVEFPGRGNLGFGGFDNGGEEVESDNRFVNDEPGGDFFRPAHRPGDADATFPKGAFFALKRVVDRAIGSLAAVVVGEEHNGVFFKTLSLEAVEDFADIVVETDDESGVVGALFFFDMRGAGGVFGLWLKRSVGRGEGDEEVEGLVLVLLDEAAGGVAEAVGYVAAFLGVFSVLLNDAVVADFFL